MLIVLESNENDDDFEKTYSSVNSHQLNKSNASQLMTNDDNAFDDFNEFTQHTSGSSRIKLKFGHQVKTSTMSSNSNNLLLNSIDPVNKPKSTSQNNSTLLLNPVNRPPSTFQDNYTRLLNPVNEYQTPTVMTQPTNEELENKLNGRYIVYIYVCI